MSTLLEGVREIISSPQTDHRGWFLNAFRHQEDSHYQLWSSERIAQVNISHTHRVGAIRGLHLQAKPHCEAKLVRCIHGRVWDVAVDLRIESLTYGQWQAVELSANKANALFIPEGCAHGFQVLEPDSELLYLHSGPWIPEAETGVRWDDPNLAISWPLPAQDLSERDLTLPMLKSLQ